MNTHHGDACRVCLMLVLGFVSPVGESHAAAAQERPGRRASALEYEGWRQYMVNCARCHGDDDVGGVMAPDLRASLVKGAVDSASFHAVVSTGRRGNGMPGFEDVLTDEQVAGILAYVQARATGRLSSGRPRRSP